MVMIQKVDYCVAEYSDNTIKLHQDLFLYSPDLYKYVLKHEKGHIGNNFWQNVVHDFKDIRNWKEHIRLTLFMVKYPKTIFKNLSPIWYFKKEDKLEYCSVQLFEYFLIVLIFSIFLYFW